MSRAIPSPADKVGQPQPLRLQPTRFCGLFPLDELGAPALGRLFLGAAVPAAYFWHTEAPRNSRGIPSPADEVGQPHPPRL